MDDWDGSEARRRADAAARESEAIRASVQADTARRERQAQEAPATPTDTERDAARLDWIARQDLDDLVFGLVHDAPHDGEYVVNAGGGPFYGKTLRDAIDAAMKGQQ